MSKYYRVRSQRQWDWLMKWFEEQGVKWLGGRNPTESDHWSEYKDNTVVELDNDNELAYRDVWYYTNFSKCNLPDFIEVSDLMEDEKMEDYVTIDSGDFDKIKFDRPQEDGNSFVVKKVNVMGYDTGKYVRDVELPTDLLIPKSLLYPKVKFTEAEKKEFDWLKEQQPKTLGQALEYISEERAACGTLYSLFEAIYGDETLSELDFIHAWADPSLIEVLPEKKYKVKVPNAPGYFYSKDPDNTLSVSYIDENIALMPEEEFTIKDINNYGLQDCEKVEV